MRTKTQEKLLKILFKALKPMVHMLLESGIGHREFSQIAKMAYVDVATKNYGIRGRDTNISRVAVMTGLTRKEVKRVRDGLRDEHPEVELRPLPASTVLHQWFFDPDFSDDDREPRLLNFEDGEKSFRDLVKKYAGDIPPGAIRTELKRTGAIEVDPDGKLRAVRRGYRPSQRDEKVLRAFERPLTALLLNLKRSTVDGKNENAKLERWPERMVEIRFVNNRNLSKAVDFSRREIQEFTEDMDAGLKQFQDPTAVTGSIEKIGPMIGVGVYYFQI